MNDIIIIGGGIGGLYTALKLNKNKKVLVFEKNNYYGGRIYTDSFSVNNNKYTIEAGAARILESHTLMINLIKMMNLYSKIMKIDSHVDFFPSKNYSLKKYSNQTGYEYIDVLLTKKFKKNELQNITFEDLLKQNFTNDEVKFILDSCGYYGDLKIQNAYDALNVFKNSVRTDKMYCILNGGFGQLINKMVKVVKEKHKCFLNSECKQIFYNDGIFTVNINDKKIFTKNLVLAIPQPNLFSLKFLRPYFPFLKSIYCVPLLRIYSIYKEKDVWFDDLKKVTTNNKLSYIIPINSKKGLIMTSYTDYNKTNYWVNKNKIKKELDMALKKNIEDVFDIKTKSPSKIKFYHWPCGVGLWKPGYDSDQIIKKVIKPNKIPLYIVGENYSRYQGWMEGALDTANICIKYINSN
jgi:protoporphyrinogen oxidase